MSLAISALAESFLGVVGCQWQRNLTEVMVWRASSDAKTIAEVIVG